MSNAFQDFRHGLRSLIKKPAFALTAVLTLTLGIGANIAVFSIVNALVLRPHPFPDLDRLVLIRAKGPRVVSEVKIAPVDFLDLQRDTSMFQNVAGFQVSESNLTGLGDAETVVTANVSARFFDLIGLQPVLGRSFSPEESESGHDAVILSYRFWQRRFNSDQNVLGDSLEVNGHKMPIVGVMPKDFRYPPATDLWKPLVITPEMKADRNAQTGQGAPLQVMARLRPKVSLKEAESGLRAFAVRLQRQYPDTHSDRSLSVLLLRKEQFGFTAPLFLTLQTAALFLLLLATANLFTLLFTRLIARQKEMALRTALGASQLRLIQLFTGEMVPLSFVAGTIALACSTVVIKLIRTGIPEDYTKWIAGWESIRLDWKVIGFAVFLTLVVGIMFAIAAAWHSGRPDLNRVLKETDRGSTGQRGLFRSVSVTAQIAFAAVLLAGAGLMVQGFFRLANVYAAFDPGNVLRLRVTLPLERYNDETKITSFYRQFLQRLAALPGVEAAGVVTNAPASNVDSPRSLFTIEGQTVLRHSDTPSADLQSISQDFFPALRIPVLEGRGISDSDGHGAPPVAVISRAMAAQFWPRKSPLGKRIRLGSSRPPAGRDASPNEWITIVGVAADVKQNWWDKDPRPVIYRSYLQAPRPGMVFAIRTTHDSQAMSAAVRTTNKSLDPLLSVTGLRPMEFEVSDSLAPIRILGILMVLFGAVAIGLAALGIYGLLAHSVAQRTHEFGIRMALGAQRQDVLRLVLAQSSRLCGIGLAIGVPLAYILMRLMSNLLYGVVAFSAMVFVALVLVLGAVALLAGLLPARRATHVDPMVALRYE